MRPSDVLRVGGDEFVVLALVNGDLEHDPLAHRLAAAVDRFDPRDPKIPRLSLSIGTISIPTGSSRPMDDLLAEADTMMYRRKRSRADR